MLVALARERNIGVDSIAVGEVHLPTTTCFNNVHWPDVARRLRDIKRFDNIVHNGVEAHEARSAEENLVAALDVIGSEVLRRVVEGLLQFERSTCNSRPREFATSSVGVAFRTEGWRERLPVRPARKSPIGDTVRGQPRRVPAGTGRNIGRRTLGGAWV